MEKPQYCRVSSVVFRHSGFLWKSVCREIGLENVINRIYQNALFGYSKERELYMKRKMLSSIMTAALAVSLLAGCGGSGNADKATQPVQNEVQTEASAVSEETAGKAAGIEEVSKSCSPEELTGTVVIWDWDGGTQQKYVDKFNEVYPNVTVEVQDVAWDDYMTKLQTSYVSGMELPDIILGEMAWRGTLFEMNICENLEEAPYNLDRSEMVPSSVPLVSDQNGKILGVEMQVTPAGFAYKRDLAKEYLGTDDPQKVGEMIKDWDSFLAVGEQVKEKSGGKVKMMASLGDVLLSTINQNIVDYVDGTNVNITEKMARPLELTMKMRDAGIIGNVEMYSASWYSAYAADEYLFYEAGAWCPPLVIVPNDPEGAGNWAVTMPPEGSFNLGGTTLSIYKDSKNKEAAWAYLQFIYFSEQGGSYMYDLTGNYSCYQPYYSSGYSPIEKEGPVDKFFGGQSLVKYYIEEAAPNAKTMSQTKYDAIINDVFQALTPKFMSDSSIDSAKALELFKEEVSLKAPEAQIQ